MKWLFLCLFVFALGLPDIAWASCEGATPAILHNAWYDKRTGTIIAETGARATESEEVREHAFVIRERQIKEDFLLVSELMVTPALAQASPVFSDWLGKGKVDVFIVPPPSENANVRAEKMRDALKSSGLATKSLVPIEVASATYLKALENVRAFISNQAGFTTLVKLDVCPYSFRDKAIYMNGRREGSASLSFPGDDRSETIVDEAVSCWGENGRTVMLGIHWNWSCQGEGDEMLLLDEVK